MVESSGNESCTIQFEVRVVGLGPRHNGRLAVLRAAQTKGSFLLGIYCFNARMCSVEAVDMRR